LSGLRPEPIEALLQSYSQETDTRVLEAGCGRMKHFDYPATMKITGLDISQSELDRNQWADELILGDVQTYTMERQFDVVVSIFVLEHLQHPQQALNNMYAWTKPGGLLIVAVPNVYSLKGLVTKYSPFWFHHFAYKYIYRRPYVIFPTTLKRCIAPGRLRQQFSDHKIEHQQYTQEQLPRPASWLYQGMLWVLRALSLGSYHPERSDYMVVVRKNS